MANDIVQEKKALRAAFLEKRRAVTGAEARAAAQTVRENVSRHILLPSDAVVAGYWPMNGEADCLPLLESVRARGHRLALPVIRENEGRLHFRVFEKEMVLRRNARYGFMEPPETEEEIIPDALLVPLLAFDRSGHRLGRGGGFYDRALTSLRKKGVPLAVGIAYACQECAAVPREDHDEPLDWVVTEKGVIRIA